MTLHLKGGSTGDLGEALIALLDAQAPGLSAGTISRLKASWQQEHRRWERRKLGRTPYVYLWVDGIHFGVRLEVANQCLLVVIGATAEGQKDLLALTDGFRESEEPWKEVLLDLKHRALTVDPRPAIGDGGLRLLGGSASGIWPHPHPALQGAYDGERAEQAAEAHAGHAKHALHQIWMAQTREHAHRAFEAFITAYAPKCPKAADCLAKEKAALLAKLLHGVPFKNGIEVQKENRPEVAA